MDREPSSVTTCLRGLANTRELSDGQLLERFCAQRDEAAFDVLVWRHGPMVLGVCRRMLRQEQDAEDAFQATFLILVRYAGSIGRRQALGCWLHRVAWRVALRARRLGDRPTRRTVPVPEVATVEGEPDVVWAELREVLDAEINRLPEKYRVPFVLCYLDGKTNDEAARELGWPKGTVQSRLAWARERLRGRLVRRGLTLSAGLASTARAAVSPALVQAARQAAVLVESGQAVEIPRQVLALSQGVLRAMLWKKITLAAGCVLFLGLVTTGIGAAMRTGAADTGDVPTRRVQADPPGAPVQQLPREAPKIPEKRYSVEMRDKPWSAVLEWYADISGLVMMGSNKPTGTFTFISPKGKTYTLGEITDILNDGLADQKYILLRRENSFTLWPADEKLERLPRVKINDLDRLGSTEPVQVIIQLTNLKAEDIGPDVKKMLSSIGSVVVLEKANQLIVTDSAGSLRRVVKLIQELEEKETTKKEDPKKR